MCGLVAVVSNGAISAQHQAAFIKSLQLLSHRGEFSFQRECYSFENFLAGANRLSFTSLEEPQPVLSPNGRFVVLLNGEIYRFHQRWSQGIRTPSDTATLARTLEVDGPGILSSMDGIFAAIALDIQRKE